VLGCVMCRHASPCYAVFSQTVSKGCRGTNGAWCAVLRCVMLCRSANQSAQHG
jgi:hypothetical protein